MERTIERPIFNKGILEGEIDDLVKEIANINIAITNKNYKVRKSKKELKELKRAFQTVENLSNKIVGLDAALRTFKKRIMELEALAQYSI